MSFYDKLNEAIAFNQSLLVVGLDPNPEMIPSGYNSTKDWLEFVIAQTADFVCAYKPTLGFYQAMGIEGLELLSQLLATIPDKIPIILDAKHGDLNTSTVFAHTIFEQWGVDAVTLTPYAGQDQVTPFLVYPDKGVFILCHTSNPGAVALQEYPTAENPFYLQVVREAKTWGTPEQLFLEAGTTNPEILAKIRAAAPERVILVRSIWGEEGKLNQILQAGLDKNGAGLLIPVSLELLANQNLAAGIKELNRQVNQARSEVVEEGSSCELWSSNVCLLAKHPHEELILQLYDIGCLLFGEYVQASGATFSYYIDLRKIISNPQIFHQVLNAYAEILKKLSFDLIAGIPYGSLPTATGLALSLHHPMVFPRKEVKAHGTRRLIEGNFHPGQKVVVVDDILITGKSVMEGAAKLESAGLKIEDIVVFLDHEEGVKERLRNNGYEAHSVLTISEITETLYAAGKINTEQYQKLGKTVVAFI
ncbi:MAG: bifunctional orotidine-5'-phosphate decarboxylase/orotate phosphoribosyltransferase [Gomphosphaeria aponina SAG 52.96 = DSM 107014]|uniref:Orotate phosphoribosyltransferase n=1 Tax=Gomphosphaeria aponina SAG 52.96 = DSM 107014 TaxID=1521640 RepID=A0A941JLJ6_9CHRO|nr:bifunctional orotidine-5'-phosphate decarboxylase/orotate phosphoribosyltransferase [Gomphosphaeria aponina SAG 52.96 = DSM 107014]